MGKMTRRSFSLRCAALAAGAGSALAHGAAAGTHREKPTHTTRGSSALPALRADVIVVGAGPSGVPAAIAAARNGAKVILLEEDTVPGGAPVDMNVSLLCGGPRVGIYREMADALNARHDFSGTPVRDFDAGNKGGCNYWYMPSAFVQVLLAMIAQESSIEMLCGARAVGALVKEGPRRRVCGVRIERAGG